MKKFLVEYRENYNNKPLAELRDFIFVLVTEAETPREAALKIVGYTGKEGIAFRVTELLPDGSRAAEQSLISLE